MSNDVSFIYGETNLDIVSQYNYLGLVFNEFRGLAITANIFLILQDVLGPVSI